jgi:dolichyl-phosphate-mannose-protein mannosyltransferase
VCGTIFGDCGRTNDRSSNTCHSLLPESTSTRFRPALSIALLAAAAGALLLRVVSIAQPLGIDQSLWASAAKGLSRHQLLYRDVWEQRPPGIYATYVAAFRIFGWTPAAIAWIDILASVATTVLLYAIGRRLASRTTGALAAALYAVLTMPAWLYRHGGFLERSVCETFIVVCVALAAWCAVLLRQRRSLAPAIGVGLFAGAAVVFKPNAGVYLPALLLWMACYRRELAAGASGTIVRPLVVALVASAIAPAITLLWLWRLGLLPEARIAVVDFNRYYVAMGFTIGGYALDFSKAVWLRMKTDPLWLAGGVASGVALWEVARRRRLPALAGLAVLWGGAAALVIIVNGARLYNTYFIQAFAPLAVLTAWLLTDGSRGSGARRLVGMATAALMVLVLLQRHYPARVIDWARADFDVLRGRLDRTAYLERFGGYENDRGYSARANEELAAYVRAHTGFDDRVFLFGINGAGVYFLSDRLTAHRFLRVNFFVPPGFPDPRFRLESVVEELSARRPRYLIFEQLHSTSEMARAVDALPQHPQIRQLLLPYRRDAQIEDFSLYRLIDGLTSETGR